MFINSNAIISGDFNAKDITFSMHNERKHKDASIIRGEKLVDMFDRNGTHILNTGEITRLAQIPNQKHSAIDLSLVSQGSLELTCRWSRYNDTLGSDHFPQIITIDENVSSSKGPITQLTFQFHKADLKKFRDGFEGKEHYFQYDDDIGKHGDNIISAFTKCVIEGGAVPNNYDKLGTCPKPKRPNLKTDYWFNEECKKAKKTSATPSCNGNHRPQTNRSSFVFIGYILSRSDTCILSIFYVSINCLAVTCG